MRHLLWTSYIENVSCEKLYFGIACLINILISSDSSTWLCSKRRNMKSYYQRKISPFLKLPSIFQHLAPFVKAVDEKRLWIMQNINKAARPPNSLHYRRKLKNVKETVDCVISPRDLANIKLPKTVSLK